MHGWNWLVLVGPSLLSIATDFLSSQTQRALVDLVPDPGTAGYGLGVFRVEAEQVAAFGHNGAVMGFQAAAFYDPGTATTVAILQNQIDVDRSGGLGGDPAALAVELLQLVNLAR